MKKLFLIMLAGSILVFTSSAWAGITNSAHDFTQTGGQIVTTEICIVCHTPHNATSSDAPLWNHEVTAATFTLYTTTGTLNATDVGQPDGVSKLCLSCHDGTVALDSFGGATGSTNISGNALLGTDLSDDHPVSFTYNTALATADGGLFDPSVQTTGINGTISEDLLFGTLNDQFECASCHDVHNGGPASAGHLLRIDNDGSALCMTCHDK